MRNSVFVCIVLILSFSISALGYTTYVAGGQIPGGMWLREMSPYLVQDTIWLTGGNTLYIEHGCEVVFSDNAVFYIMGPARLVAGAKRCPGDPQDSVWFKYSGPSDDTLIGWDGLRFLSAPGCTLSNCHISGVVVRDGAGYGAVANINGNLAIENCLIDGNIGGGGGGGGIFMETTRESSLKNSTITNNKSFGDGGGIYIDASGFSMGGNFIDHNELLVATKNGGGAYLTGDFNSTGDIFSWNKSQRDGGGVFLHNYTGTIEEPIMSFNLAHRRGGGVSISGGSPEFSRGDFCSNYAFGLEGAGVYMQDNALPTFTNCVVSYNDGGGIWVTSTAGGNVKIINTTIAKNYAGPGLRLGWTYGSANVLLFNSAVSQNTASWAPCQQINITNTSDLHVSHSFISNPAQICLDVGAEIHHIEPADFITGDPSFADTFECNIGWIPSCAPTMSVLIDAGAESVDFLSETVYAPNIDFLENDRFMDLGWDIGAFENSCLGMLDRGSLPEASSLIAIRPNPFNAVMSIEFQLADPSNVSVEIFDMSGRKVDEIVAGNLKSGFHRIEWTAENRPSGIYNVKLDIGGEVHSAKATLIK